MEIIKSIVAYRLNRNKYAKLNSDMAIEYGIKIPTATTYGQQISEPDIDWIISASASSPNSAALMTTQSSRLISNTSNYEFDETHSQPQLVFKRKPSATTMTKRLPWEDQQQRQPIQNIPKVMKSREVAPLKAFPLVVDNLDSMAVDSSQS
jgi:hypothetical protein